MSDIVLYTKDYCPYCKRAKASLTQISILARGDANLTTATAVDIVFVYDNSVDPLLPKIATDWFANRDRLQTYLRRHIESQP